MSVLKFHHKEPFNVPSLLADFERDAMNLRCIAIVGINKNDNLEFGHSPMQRHEVIGLLTMLVQRLCALNTQSLEE